jgi:hypothetical protein
MKSFGVLCLLGVAFLIGCDGKQEQSSKQASSLTHSAVSNSAAGVSWSVPDRWSVGPARQMRVATYSLPATKEDEEAGECAVFYFGKGQGGDVEANIDRWILQFEGSPAVERSSKEINGLDVTLVKIAGTFLSPGGPMMQSQGKKESYRLLGAIVEVPEGLIFFKCTGPANTISSAEGEFDELFESLSKE